MEVGDWTWPRPWRGMNTTGSPSISPRRTASDGWPQGEAISSQRELSMGMS